MWYARKRHTEKLQGGMERDKLGILTNVFYKQREDFAKQQKEQEERFTFPEEVEEITDIVYIEDGKKEHRLNVYQGNGHRKNCRSLSMCMAVGW